MISLMKKDSIYFH